MGGEASQRGTKAVKILQKTPSRLVLGERDFRILGMAAVLPVLGLLAEPSIRAGDYGPALIPALVAVGVAVFACRMELSTRVVLDRGAGLFELRSRRLLGSTRQRMPLAADTRVEQESTQVESGRPHVRRLVLVQGDRRLPFKRIFREGDQQPLAEELNAWLAGDS